MSDDAVAAAFKAKLKAKKLSRFDSRQLLVLTPQ